MWDLIKPIGAALERALTVAGTALRNQPVGAALPVGVIAGWLTVMLLRAISDGFIMPIIFRVEMALPGGYFDLSPTIHGVLFQFSRPLSATTTLGLLLALIYFALIRPPEYGPRATCRDCRSEIPELATRCPFCTATQPEAN